MSEPEGFLRRWARRKQEAAQETAAPAAEPAAPPPDSAAPTIDLASLPSLETITAETDIRVFLAPGVPAELTRAALRRAWAADPQIRDFIGIAENQWDFTAPEGLYGFGQLGVEEARRLAAAILGDGGEAPAAPPMGDPELVPDNAALPPSAETPAVSSDSVPPINRDAKATPIAQVAAVVDRVAVGPVGESEKVGEAPEPAGKFMLRRTHGRALPE